MALDYVALAQWAKHQYSGGTSPGQLFLTKFLPRGACSRKMYRIAIEALY